MGTGTTGVKLLSVEEITRREKQAKKLLRQKFKTTPALKPWRGHLDIGLARLTEKGAIARTMVHHMKRRGFTTIAELADKIYVDPNSEVLLWMCLPTAFRPTKDSARDLGYLLVLCNLEWDKERQTYVPITTERPT